MIKYKTADDFFRNARPMAVGERVGRRDYIKRLLGVYPISEVIEDFRIPVGEVWAMLERCDPVAERRYELQSMAAVADLRFRIVGAEGFFDD